MRVIQKHVMLSASVGLSTLLACTSLMAETPQLTSETPESAAHAPQEAPTSKEETSEPETSVQWGGWKIQARSFAGTEATGEVRARSSKWLILAESATRRSGESGDLIDFRGEVRLVEVHAPEAIVVGSQRAEVDTQKAIARFVADDHVERPFFTRASRDWIVHARRIEIRLMDGHVTLERIGLLRDSDRKSRAFMR